MCISRNGHLGKSETEESCVNLGCAIPAMASIIICICHHQERAGPQRRQNRNRDIKFAKSTTLSQMPAASKGQLAHPKVNLNWKSQRRAIIKCKQWTYSAAKSVAQFGAACYREFARMTGWMLLTSLLIPHSTHRHWVAMHCIVLFDTLFAWHERVQVLSDQSELFNLAPGHSVCQWHGQLDLLLATIQAKGRIGSQPIDQIGTQSQTSCPQGYQSKHLKGRLMPRVNNVFESHPFGRFSVNFLIAPSWYAVSDVFESDLQNSKESRKQKVSRNRRKQKVYWNRRIRKCLEIGENIKCLEIGETAGKKCDIQK